MITVINMIWDLFKIFVSMSILRSPWLVVGILLGCTLLLLLGGIFIKFKNGYFSWICYILLLSVTAFYAGTSLYVLKNPPEDLQLRRAQAVSISYITYDGIAVRQRMRTREIPLLGVTIPNDISKDYLDTYLRNSLSDVKVYAQESKLYNGVVLSTDEIPSLNEYFIEQGYVSVSDPTPVSYNLLKNRAQNRHIGIWEYVSSDTVGVSYLFNTLLFCFVSLLALLTVMLIKRTKYGEAFIVTYLRCRAG